MRRSQFLSFLLAILLLTGSLPTPGKASPASNSDRPVRLALLDYIPSAMTTLAVQGNYAYVGAGPSLLVIDLSDPAHLRRVAYRLLPAMAKQVAVSPGRVYVLTDKDTLHADDNQIFIFNIANPEKPELIGNFGPANIFTFAAAGTRLILGGSDGVSILDVSDPHNYVWTVFASQPDTISGFISKIIITGNTALVAISGYIDSGHPKIWVLNISDPGQLKLTGKLEGSDLPLFITDLAISGDILALAGYNDAGYSFPKFDLIDLSDPAHPVTLSSNPLTTSGEGTSIAILDQTVYVAAQDQLISAYDIRDPAAPVMIGQGEDPVWGLATANSLIYVAAGASGLAIYAGQGPGGLLKRGSLLGIGAAEDLAVQDHRLYIADGGLPVYGVDYSSGGLAIASVPPHGQTEVIGKLMQGGHGVNVEVDKEQAYLVAGSCFLRSMSCDQALNILDVSNPQAPSLLGSYQLERDDNGQPYAELLSIHNHIAYINTKSVYSDEKGLAVLDVSEPSTPTLLSLYQPPIPPHERYGSSNLVGAAITGTYGLLSITTQADDVFTNTLQVFDISNPLTFIKLTSYSMFFPLSIFVQGQLGFVVDRDRPWPGETLRFLDLIQLPQVQVLSSKAFSNAIQDVAYDGRYAYVADGEAGLHVIDLADPYSPQEVFVYHTPGNAVAVAVDGDWVYLADENGGVLIFRKVTPQFYLPFL
jgi:hypothetical protein